MRSAADAKHSIGSSTQSAIVYPHKMEAKDCERYDDAIAGAKAVRDEFFETIITDMLNNVPCPPEWDTDSIATMARHGNWKELLCDIFLRTVRQSDNAVEILDKALNNKETALYKIFTCRRGCGRIIGFFAASSQAAEADGTLNILKKEKESFLQMYATNKALVNLQSERAKQMETGALGHDVLHVR